MTQPVIQTSFNSGEWAPQLYSRVDLQKYHSGAALIRNFTVDYRGGATTRPGTKYIATSATPGTGAPPRLVTFQASFTVDYVVEFGVDNTSTGYVAFYNNGAQVVTAPNVPYTIASPYALSELSQLKFNQNVDQLIINHPNHPTYILKLNSATNWTLTAATIGSTVTTPTGQSAASTFAPSSGTCFYAYVVTAVDVNGQESDPSSFATISNVSDLRTTAGSNVISWGPVTGATSYNVYKAEIRYGGAVDAGAQFGFVGNCTGDLFTDSNITPDFTSSPPVPQNPFSGSGVQTVAITNHDSYGNVVVPSVTFTGGGGSGTTAIAIASVLNATVNFGGIGYTPGDLVYLANGVTLGVATTSFSTITGIVLGLGGSVDSGSVAPSPSSVIATSGSGVGGSFNLNWGITTVQLINAGAGYSSAPTVVFSSGAAAATATLGAPGSGNPTVSGFIDQRLCLAGPPGSPQQLDLSQPGSYFNFNTTNPVQDDNAIEGTLVSGQLNTIEWLVQQPQGLIILADKASWLLNGGSPGAAVTATAFVARTQAYNGAASVCPPIVANDNILYLQAKGSIVRDLVFNYYTQVFTGSDISILSSHLFYGFQLLEWCWAEEPFKIVWAVRNDGTMLTLTFLKEQELIAWSHSDTQGFFKSVATVVENTAIGEVDAVYTAVQRTINGTTSYYIERFVELNWPQDYVSSWQVDAGIGYNGAPATSFSGATQLAGAVVTGVADGAVINFTMPTNGTFVFGPGGTAGLTGIANASVVTVGLAFVPQLETLPLDLGEPTVQGKRKKINAVTLKVANTLGLEIGSTDTTMVPMSDLVLGNQNEPGNYTVTGLVTGEARTYVDPNWTTPGQYFIQQPNPYPASILGVIPEIEIGDTK